MSGISPELAPAAEVGMGRDAEGDVASRTLSSCFTALSHNSGLLSGSVSKNRSTTRGLSAISDRKLASWISTSLVASSRESIWCDVVCRALMWVERVDRSDWNVERSVSRELSSWVDVEAC